MDVIGSFGIGMVGLFIPALAFWYWYRLNRTAGWLDVHGWVTHVEDLRAEYEVLADDSGLKQYMEDFGENHSLNVMILNKGRFDEYVRAISYNIKGVGWYSAYVQQDAIRFCPVSEKERDDRYVNYPIRIKPNREKTLYLRVPKTHMFPGSESRFETDLRNITCVKIETAKENIHSSLGNPKITKPCRQLRCQIKSR